MESTIPTIAASTGVSFRSPAIRAELPLTTSTVSPVPGIDRVDRHQMAAARRTVRLYRLHDEQLVADEPLVLAGRYHRSDDLGQDHRLRAGLADREGVLEIGVGSRNHVHRHQLADPARRGGAGVGRGLDGRHVAPHDRGDVARADLLPADESVTLAALTIASAASIIATRPLVSTSPNASPMVSSARIGRPPPARGVRRLAQTVDGVFDDGRQLAVC